MNTPDHTTTTLDTIVVEKDKLLTKLRENRQKHEEIYKAACEGFWVQAKNQLDAKQIEFNAMLHKAAADLTEISAKAEADFGKSYANFGGAIDSKTLKSLFNFSNSNWGGVSVSFGSAWVPSYPTEYLEDYDRAINKLEFSVADKVSLSAQDFDAYVRNNWSWRKSFIASNSAMVSCTTGASFLALGNGYLTSAAYLFASGGMI